MYIKSRSATVVCHLSVSILSAFSTWLLFHIFGNEAWRLFPTWVLLVASVYYAINALVVLFWRRRDSGRVVCPMLQGAIIVSSFSLAIFRLIFNFNGLMVIGLEGAGMILVDFVLPALFFIDWILFTKKGGWRMVDPFYWLAFATCYACGILLSAEFMGSENVLRYPYAVLDFNVIGLDVMLSWFVLMGVLTLIMGYICVVVDFAMSGRLSKYIVLPRIKTIVVEEEVKEKPKIVKVKPQTGATTPKPTNKASVKIEPKVVAGQKGRKINDGSAKPKSAVKTEQKIKSGAKNSKKKPVALLEARASSTVSEANKKSKTVKVADRK